MSHDRTAHRTPADPLFAAIVESCPDAVLVADDGGTYVAVNAAASELTGFSRPELLAKAVWDLTPEPRRDLGLRLWQQFLEAGRQDGEYELVCRDRTTVPVEYRAVAHVQPGLHFVFLRDISRRRRAAEALEHARAAAEAASRAKDEFLATLSHELRTPLNVVLGYARLLREGRVEAERVPAVLDALERNARAQFQLVSDLLDVSSATAGKLTLHRSPVDLRQIVREAIDGVMPAAHSRGVVCHLDGVPPGHAIVSGDESRLGQVMHNLLSNAIKFTPAGGHVVIVVGRDRGEVSVEVRDSGAGIEPSFLPRIFDRFTQADASPARATGGLGLGLAIVRQIVLLHGGRVEASSAGLGHGATFRLWLPAADTGNG